MQFTQTFSREKLQSIPAERRLQAIVQYVDRNYHSIIQAAAVGKTSCLHQFVSHNHLPCSSPGQYIVTLEDVIEGFKAKFPDCSVSYAEEWVDVRPGHREQKTGIRIDWS